MGLAWVFPGQGSQTVGMGKAVAARFAAAQGVYLLADDALGFPLSQLCWDGPEELLNQTINSQPAILATSIAHLVALRELGQLEEQPLFVAGHSLGEYTALVAAGSLDLGAALQLLRQRGIAMQKAGDATGDGSAMAAVIGADDAMLAEVAAEMGVDLANFNAPGQTVISGSKPAIERATEELKKRGVRRVMPLAVSMASHSRLMHPAAEEMRPLIEAADLSAPNPALIPNVTAEATSDPATIKRLLVEQLYSPVRWVDSVKYMAANGVDTIIEIGAGKVLAGLIKRIAPEINTISSESLL